MIIFLNGSLKVHIRVASPPIKYPCYMGINIPTREELIANKLDPPELAEAVGTSQAQFFFKVLTMVKSVDF